MNDGSMGPFLPLFSQLVTRARLLTSRFLTEGFCFFFLSNAHRLVNCWEKKRIHIFNEAKTSFLTSC